MAKDISKTIEDSSLIGLQNQNSKGEYFAIWKYYDKNNITVVFEDNTPKEGVTLEQFKAGNVFKPDIKDNYVGQTIKNEVFDEYMIVEQKDNTVTLENPQSGALIYNVPIEDALNGFFREDDDEDFSSFPVSPSKRGIIAEQERTLRNIIALLNKYKRAYVVRPTGFGKTTKLWPGLVNSGRYRTCLYVAITTDAAARAKIKPRLKRVRVDVMTYARLRSYSEKDIAKKFNYDLVFFDEAHSIGGADDDDNGQGAVQTFKAVKALMESSPETDFVGATATDYRMDGINVAFRMFNNHYCYPYSIGDAIRDGYITPPRYLVGFNNVEEKRGKVKEEIEKMTYSYSREEALKKFSEFPFDEIDANCMPIHISKACNSLFPSANYLRFLVFYLTNEDIAENKAKIVGWFKEAYPDFEVNILIVTSKAKHKSCQKAIDALTLTPSDPEKYKGKIDLLFTCEKLAAEYHSDLLNGLILDRKTASLQKYTQMIGRVLSCTKNNPVVIFDIWDNIHADFKNLFSNTIPDELEKVSKDTFMIDKKKLGNPDYETLIKNRKGIKDLSKMTNPKPRGSKDKTGKGKGKDKPKTSSSVKDPNPVPDGQMSFKDYEKSKREHKKEESATSKESASNPDTDLTEEIKTNDSSHDDIQHNNTEEEFDGTNVNDENCEPESTFIHEPSHYDDDSHDFGRKNTKKSEEPSDTEYESEEEPSGSAEDINIIASEEELGYQYMSKPHWSYSDGLSFRPLNLAMKEIKNPLDIVKEVTVECYQENIRQIIESYKKWYDAHPSETDGCLIYSSREQYLADKETGVFRVSLLKSISENGYRGGVEDTSHGKKTWLNIPVDDVVQYMINNYSVA